MEVNMKKLIFAFCLFPTLAFAAPKPAEQSGDELGISDKDCAALVEYQPSPDVEYKSGVDVHGKPVLEADITPTVIKSPDVYSFPITIDTVKYLHLTTPKGLEGEANVGTITISKGQAAFNGHPLEGDAMALLKAVCSARKAPQTPAKPAEKPQN